ncbi:MAG: hypothetical protein WCG83_02690 [Candidatus Peregrinibacteria bacterium]
MRPLPPISIHGILALTAIVAVIVVARESGRPSATVQTSHQDQQAEIAIEHSMRASVSISVSALKGQGILDIVHDAAREIYISLPDSWTRREVKGVSLATVAADPPMLGFKRWRLPPGSTVSFAIPAFPSSILAHNPSGIPLEVRVTRVDLDNDRTERDVVLMQKKSVTLW